MVSEGELEEMILAKLEPTTRFCADLGNMLEVRAGDATAKTRILKMVDHVRREASAFAVRVEAAGPFATASDVEQVMRREFDAVALAKAGVLDMLELFLDRGALVDRVERV